MSDDALYSRMHEVEKMKNGGTVHVLRQKGWHCDKSIG